MLSYTSNSSRRVPNGPWGKTWLLSIAIVVLSLGGWEALWRSKGFSPLLARDKSDAWVVARSRVKMDSIVLLGSSRIQSDVQPEAFAGEMDGKVPIQLAVAGFSPLPILEDLAKDQSFSGLAIVGLTPHVVFNSSSLEEKWFLEYSKAHKSYLASPARWSEVRLRSYVEGMFVFRHPAVSPLRAVYYVVFEGVWPHKPFFLIRPDRFAPLDFAKTDAKRRQDVIYEIISTQGHPCTERELEVILKRMQLAVSQIQRRGGKVVFVHFPTSGKVREGEEQRYPRPIYWDALEASTKAITIHSDDYPTLKNFHCPDGSHLDLHDAGPFTKALARLLKIRGLR